MDELHMTSKKLEVFLMIWHALLSLLPHSSNTRPIRQAERARIQQVCTAQRTMSRWHQNYHQKGKQGSLEAL